MEVNLERDQFAAGCRPKGSPAPSFARGQNHARGALHRGQKSCLMVARPLRWRTRSVVSSLPPVVRSCCGPALRGRFGPPKSTYFAVPLNQLALSRPGSRTRNVFMRGRANDGKRVAAFETASYESNLQVQNMCPMEHPMAAVVCWCRAWSRRMLPKRWTQLGSALEGAEDRSVFGISAVRKLGRIRGPSISRGFLGARAIRPVVMPQNRSALHKTREELSGDRGTACLVLVPLAVVDSSDALKHEGLGAPPSAMSYRQLGHSSRL